MVDKTEKFSANEINNLEFPFNVIRRPSMYLGDRGSQQSVAVREIIDNAVHESIRGFADRVKVTFGKDKSITVQDNGRGLPVDINKKTGKNGIILTMATLHAGSNFATNIAAGKAGAGLNGVGASAANALSKRFDAIVFKNNKKYSLSFQDGFAGHFSVNDDPNASFTRNDDILVEKDSRSTAEKKIFKTGTTIKLWFNPDRFPANEEVDINDLVDRLKYTAFIVPGLHIDITDENRQYEDGSFYTWEFYSEHGLQEMVEVMSNDSLLPNSTSKNNPFTEKGIYYLQTDGHYIETITNDEGKVEDAKRIVTAEIAFRYGTGYEKNLASFVNTIHTHLGGVHEQAFEKALVDAFGQRMRSMRGILTAKDEQPIIDDFFEGMTVALSVNVPEPQFVGQQKDKLSGPEVKKALTKALTELLTKFANDNNNQKFLKPMFEKVAQAAQNRKNASEAKLAKRKSSQVSSSAMPAKLSDCEFTGTDEAELLICLKGDTPVRLSDGSTPTIESLVGEKELTITSYNGSEKIETPVIDVFKTREVTEMLEIEFEDGSIVECTPEHRFLVDDEWIIAKDIVEGTDIKDVN